MWKNAPNGGLLTYKTERKKTCKFLKIAEMLEGEKGSCRIVNLVVTKMKTIK